MDDRERAHKYLTEEFAMKGGIVSQHDEDILAAEFAAVRLPLERRVAQLEAALRDAMGVHEYMTDAGMTGVEWAVKHKYDPVWDRIRAALAVTVVANPGSAGIAEPTQEPEG